jgi:hypothetical protein
VRAEDDSVDLGILEALTPAFRRVRGRLAVNAQVGGTWEAPRLAGSIGIRNGAMEVPGLGVRFGSVEGEALLRGDSLMLQDVRITSGGGDLAIGGAVRLERLSHPLFDLDLRASQFLAIDVRNFLTLTGTGDLTLRGPLLGATLGGNLTANSGVLYFADLVNKRVIDLEDPAYADLLDTTLIRRENLGNKFQNRFMDSLRVEDLRVGIGSDVWLRSAEAAEYMAEFGVAEPSLPRFVRAAFGTLGLITFFTAGEQEVRSWPLRAGSTAQQAAGSIHSDLARGFIRAETIAYDDFVATGGWTAGKAAGKVRLEGKQYIVQDGDVLLIRFNV